MLNKNLRTRFVMYFFITMLISTLIATLGAGAALGVRYDREFSRNQPEIASALSELLGDENNSLVESISIPSYEVYSIHRIDRNSLFVSKYLDRLDAGEIVMEDHWLLPNVTTYFAAGNNYYQISLFPTGSIVMSAVLSLAVAIVGALLLGTTIAIFAGKRFLRPIRDLSKATEQVAQGNFDVHVDVPENIEMGRLCSNFNSMAKDLSRIETLQREFTSNVSHEFKTPLASISGFAKLLQQPDIEDEERQEYIGIIAEESERLSRLSANILRLTKLENTDGVTEKSEFSLDEQLRRCIVLLEHQWSGKNIEMNVELEPAEVCSNAELLQEVWVNLLSNAIKFTPEGGRIDVRLTETLDTVDVEIEDDGCGMDEEVKRRIFDKFFQGDKSHSGEGNGLGLSLVKRIAELLGAQISVESSPGVGSLFRVRLPRE